jgi:GT2 family glycosyltransferase
MTTTGDGADGRVWPKVAIVVLNYNTPEMTDALAFYLDRQLEYPRKKLYVIDNGSERAPASTTHRLPANLGFTRGMHEGFLAASREDDYDAYWLLNSDLGFEYGNDVLSRLCEVLFSSESFGQIAPQHNSPHKFMEYAEVEAQPVPYLEATATLVKASTIRRVGFWDLELTLGWGVDYDYGHRVREAGLLNVLTNRARITHKEHKSIRDFSDYTTRACAEMNAVLSAKYGADWGRIMSDAPPVVPLILSCDRDAELTARFVESYRTVQSALARPVVVIDTSACEKLSARYLAHVSALHPRAVYVHPREPGESVYDSVQQAVNFAFVRALSETREGDQILFVEDDIRFSAQFAERLRGVRLGPEAGMMTFYQPGNGYGSTVINPGHFYGTQCVLFPRRRVEEIVENWTDITTRIPPGYDIRWSRFLGERGYKLYATERSYVQHLSSVSRLHGHGTHNSNVFRG